MVLISDLWVPDVWITALAERQATFPSLFNSGIVVRTPLMDQIATGAGVSANIPFFKDITDQDDEVQVEDTAPVTDNGQPSGKMVGTMLNRVCKSSAGAMAAQISGSDPMAHIIGSMTDRRLKQRQKTLIAQLRGLFGSAGAANGAAALSGVRLGGVTSEPFDENGADATSDQLFSPDMFIDAKALMGELQQTLKNGCLLMHSTIKARLEKLDALNFRTLVNPSGLPFDITTYRDIPLFLSDSLARPGTGGGFVYDTYLMAKGTVGYGEKAQKGDVSDMASLQYFKDADKNKEIIWDRTRFLLHVDGTKWVGNPAGESATNAELQTPGNWQLVYQTPNRVGAVCIRTNG